MAYYRVCPSCGCNIDPGEICDCRAETKEVAAKLGISESYYSLIERGERQQNLDIALASKLSDVFEISLEYIIAQENSRI